MTELHLAQKSAESKNGRNTMIFHLLKKSNEESEGKKIPRQSMATLKYQGTRPDHLSPYELLQLTPFKALQ